VPRSRLWKQKRKNSVTRGGCCCSLIIRSSKPTARRETGGNESNIRLDRRTPIAATNKPPVTRKITQSIPEQISLASPRLERAELTSSMRVPRTKALPTKAFRNTLFPSSLPNARPLLPLTPPRDPLCFVVVVLPLATGTGCALLCCGWQRLYPLSLSVPVAAFLSLPLALNNRSSLCAPLFYRWTGGAVRPSLGTGT
jgi:hypothetical protein